MPSSHVALTQGSDHFLVEAEIYRLQAFKVKSLWPIRSTPSIIPKGTTPSNVYSFFQIALKLTQMQGPSREFRQPLLDVIIRNMHADVVDRKWDTQGSVTMGNITVLDYITVGTCV